VILAIDLLHYPSQVRTAPAFGQAGAAASPEELQLASMLIDSASGSLDWSQYRDDTAAELRALVEAKLAGQPLADSAEEPAAILSLLDALKQSVAAAGQVTAKQDVPAVTVRGQDVAKQSVSRCQNIDPRAPRRRQRKEPRRTA
jgi:non-homologous end joining protein Ku